MSLQKTDCKAERNTLFFKPSTLFIQWVLAGLLALSICIFTGCQNGSSLGQALDGILSNWLAPKSEQAAPVALYDEVWHLIRDNYLDETLNGQNWARWQHRYDRWIQTREDAYVAIDTMIASLNDPYTRFLQPREAQEQNIHIDSKLYGIGIHIAEKDNQIMVVAPIPASPADRAGIRSQDKILKVNGETVMNLDLDQVADKIRGPKGTQVNLTVKRDSKTLFFEVIRDEISIKTVFSQPVNHEIGYIQLTSFISQDTVKEMKAALLQQQKKKALILDLRGNNGGLLSNALDISDMFLSRGVIVSIKGRPGEVQVFRADPAQLFSKPLVVLIDQGSASASEIVGAALKENRRAILIGYNSFGKGLVQKINQLSNGSELNLTISRYLTPLGHDINHKGIRPNHLVPIQLSDWQSNRDPQKEYAIRYLNQKLHQAS